MALKIGINGLGRIGRMVIRAIIESKNKTTWLTKIRLLFCYCARSAKILKSEPFLGRIPLKNLPK